MKTLARTVGRLRPVRLTDVPLKIRRRAGKRLYELAVQDGDIAGAVQLEAAVEQPSDRLYWVDAAQAERVLR